VPRIYLVGANWAQHYYVISILRHDTLIVISINGTGDCLNKT